jgi:hypothetical protein
LTIFTYFKPDNEIPDAPRILPQWERAWNAVGVGTKMWVDEPVTQPLFRAFKKAVAAHPTINPKQYQRNNWMRWLAALDIFETTLGRAGTLHYMDSDVFPTAAWSEKALAPEHPITVWEATRCPCAVSLRGYAAAAHLVEEILNATTPLGVCHFSDQEFFRTTQTPAYDVCRSWPDTSKPLVHISTNALIQAGVITRATQKADALKSIL